MPITLPALKTELTTDPKVLGYAPLVTLGDDVSLAAIINFVRDGITSCPVNGVIGPNGAITGATNATPVVAGVGGNTAANGTWTITRIDANSFSLTGPVAAVGNGAYTSGGTWTWCAYLRNPSVKTQDILGAMLPADLTTTTLTIQEQIILSGLMNDGAIALVNPDGTDNANVKHIKKLVVNPSPSYTAVLALENSFYSRAAQLFGVGTNVSVAEIGAALNS
jgi:hypothetical protein